MSNLKALNQIAFLPISPATAYSGAETGSPKQVGEVDPDEDVALKPVTGEPMKDTAKAD